MEDITLPTQSLAELTEQIEKTIPTAKSLSYVGVSVDMTLEVAQELLNAVKYYQEPRFFGWPLSLVELYLDQEENIPISVFKSYEHYMSDLLKENDTHEAFFIDEAYDVKGQ
ncbi:hypothetical protein ACXHQB_23595 [Vibrio parahaemolyticus]|uniref:hypothetical protein n=1 Tax=Vibrio parahaemolyticus TaxID=670 RepID=UPI001D166FA2|nr:hypothetical protein [Vibrio parahaemolyticus]MCC3798284.1 hypothetical protein [Vibrio parahaemolyticus]